jgi:hypothetical protein
MLELLGGKNAEFPFKQGAQAYQTKVVEPLYERATR